jgi:DNA-binding CsgD family transcriptional regulator
LSIAERTVKFHRASACEKLGVGSTAQLIARMMLLKEKGLV